MALINIDAIRAVTNAGTRIGAMTIGPLAKPGNQKLVIVIGTKKKSTSNNKNVLITIVNKPSVAISIGNASALSIGFITTITKVNTTVTIANPLNEFSIVIPGMRYEVATRLTPVVMK